MSARARGLGLVGRLLVALVLPAIGVFALMATVAERAARRALDDALGERLSSVAGAAATAIEPRVVLLEAGDEDARTARAARRRLDAAVRGADVARALVVRASDDAVVVDTLGSLAIGTPYPRRGFDAVELTAVRTGRAATSVLFSGPDGMWKKTGYAPLLDDTVDPPTLLGYVVVEGDAAFFSILDELRRTVLGVSVAGFLVLAALAVISARGVARPLSALSQVALAIGRGELDTPVPSEGPREAVVLGDTMRDMARALREREEELQVMLAGIAHEVRNPLTGIELFGGLLKEDLAPDDPRQKHVGKILKQIGVLSQVVSDFLDFARRRPLERAAVEVRELLDELVALTAAEREAKAQPLTIDAPSALRFALDRDAIHRALLNLLRNASQAAPTSTPLELRAALEPDGRLALSVVDHGPGVPPEVRADIFRPFFTTKQKGTGLGLALVKKAADAHGGSIALVETPGGGATFVLTLAPP
jgi:two-component system OmpR family sensor kinase